MLKSNVQEDHASCSTIIDSIQAIIPLVSLKTSDIGRRLQKIITLLRNVNIPGIEKQLIPHVPSIEIDNIENEYNPPLDDLMMSPSDNEIFQMSPKSSSPSPINDISKKIAFWRLEGTDGQIISSNINPNNLDASIFANNVYRRLLPNHPCKAGALRLLENWPDYLERLLPSANTLISKTLEMGGGFLANSIYIFS